MHNTRRSSSPTLVLSYKVCLGKSMIDENAVGAVTKTAREGKQPPPPQSCTLTCCLREENKPTKKPPFFSFQRHHFQKSAAAQHMPRARAHTVRGEGIVTAVNARFIPTAVGWVPQRHLTDHTQPPPRIVSEIITIVS